MTAKLNAAARAELRDAGVSQAAWARANFMTSGRWSGDACGCPDSRCIGYHHDDPDDCGCLPVLLAGYLKGEGFFAAPAGAPAGGAMTGPFNTEAEARAAVAAILASPPGTGAWGDACRALLEDACRAAGVELGEFDRRIIGWLAGWEPATVAVVAGLISRAHGHMTLTPEQAETVRLALDEAKWAAVRKTRECEACDAVEMASRGQEAVCERHKPDAERAEEFDALGLVLFGGEGQ
jgi:hypothetical protein